MNLGAHLSIAGGLHRSLERAREETATALQVFTRNQRQWNAGPPLTAEAIARFHEARNASPVTSVIAHASYLVNLATPVDRILLQSIDALRLEYERAEALGMDALVFHPGTHMGAGIEEGLRRIAEAVRGILAATHGFRCRLAFETTAGAGTQIGSRFEEIARLLAVSGPIERLGVCVDTCHLHAAGYDLRSEASYRATRRQLDSIVGLSHVVAMHLNDAGGKLGGRLDRHAHIGRGRIGREGFRCIMKDRKLAHVPKVIETPKGTFRGRSWDRINLALLRELRDR